MAANTMQQTVNMADRARRQTGAVRLGPQEAAVQFGGSAKSTGLSFCIRRAPRCGRTWCAARSR